MRMTVKSARSFRGSEAMLAQHVPLKANLEPEQALTRVNLNRG